MAETIKGINVLIGSDTTGLSKALSDVNKKSRDIQSELRQVEKLLKLDPKNTELVAQRQKLLGEAIGNSKQKLDALRAAQEQVNEQLKKGEINEGQYRAFQREVVKTEQELEGLEKQLGATTDASKSLGDRLQETGEKMKSAGETMTKYVTVPLAAAGAGMLVVGTQFDDAFDKIRISTGMTGEALEGLEQDFRDVAQRVPSDFDDISTAIAEYNVRLDISGRILQDLSTQTLNLVRITDGDLNTTIEETSQSFQAFNIPAEEYGENLDYIFRVSQFTGTEMSRLQQNLVKFAPALKQMGFGFQESAALMGFFDKAGVEVEQAMMGLNKGLINMAKTGVTDAHEALQKLFDEIKNAPSDIRGTQIAVEIFGSKAGPALASAIREGKLGYEELVSVLLESGETINGVAKETDDWAEGFANLKNQVMIATEPIANELFGALNGLVSLIEKVVEPLKGLAEAFGNLPQGTQLATLSIVGVVAAIGPLLVVIGQMATGISAVSGLLKTIAVAQGVTVGALISTIGLVVAAIGLLIAAGILLYKNWDTIKAKLSEVWTAVNKFFTETIPAAIATALEWFKQLPEKVAIFFSELPENIGYVIGLALGKIARFWVDAINWAITETPKIIESIIGFISSLPGKIGTWLTNAVQSFVQWGANLFTWAQTSVPSIIEGIGVFFSELPAKLLEVGVNAVRGLWDGMLSMVGWLGEQVKNFVGGIVRGFREGFDVRSPSRIMAEIGRNITLGLATGMSEAQKKLAEQVQKIVQAITSTVQSMTGDLSNALNLTKAKLDLEAAALADTGAEAAKLGIELRTLAAEKENLTQKTDILTAAYETAKDRLGENNETTKQYAYELQMAQVELQKTEIAIEKTNRAIEQQADQQAIERLKSRLSEVKTTFEMAGNQLVATGTQAQRLKNDLDSLGQQIDIQRQIVDAATLGYEKMKLEKGGNSEEAENLRLKVLEERKALSDLEKQLYETGSALRDHAQEFRALADEMDQVEKKYRDDLADALEEYQRKVADVNRQLIEDERRITEEYASELQSRTDALRNFVGLFDAVATKDVYGWQLLENLRGQVGAFESWQENMAALATRGVDEELLQQLREMGPEAGVEIAALNTLTDEQLNEYVTLWQEKNQLAREEAVSQLQQQKVEMQQKLVEIRNTASEQLQAYKAEWEKKNAEIRKNAETELQRIQNKFNDTAKAGTQYGVELVLNFALGMESQFDRLRRAVAEAQSIIGDLDPTVRHSPSLVDRISAGLSEIYNAYRGLVASIQAIDFSLLKLPDLGLTLGQGGAAALTAAGGTTYNNGGNNIYITVQDGEDMMRVLHRYGVRVP